MSYQKPHTVAAVILDWAGTVVDFGSFAPTQIFVQAFAECGIALSLKEARGPMGIGKWQHIRALCDEPGIAERFLFAQGRLPTDADVTAIYQRFMALQIEKVADHSTLIPGALECISALRQRAIKIGSCSGYPKAVMDRVVELAALHGFLVDHVVASDEVPVGRPSPAQALANVVALGISDVAACVKVDDTTPGIIEGRSAGMWTVALTCSGNAMGLTYEQFEALPAEKLNQERSRIVQMFEASRPHFLIDTISDLPQVIDQINTRLRRGETPQSV